MSSAAPARGASQFTRELSEALRAELLAGKYRLLAGLGRGGMADVFLGSARGPAGVNKLVVIKRLRDGHGDDPMLISMFLDEARLAARLNHPNIVHTYEVHEVGQEYIIVMEYLEGQTLRAVIKAMLDREQTCDAALAAHLMIEVLDGLHYVHEIADYDGSPLGIVHRDISPQNLFVTYEGQVKVLDFGIAKGTLNATETQDGVLKGKFAYMAPEQASAEAIDRRADIFAAGVVLWELLTGQRLFRGETANTLLQVVGAPIPVPSDIVATVPPELDAIVLKALERSADARFGSALQMSSALSDFLERSRHIVRNQDVARTMHQLFGEEREEMTKRVQSYMSSRWSLDKTPIQERELTASTELLQTGTPGTRVPAHDNRRQTWPLLATAAVALASVAGVFWARAHPRPPDPIHSTATRRVGNEKDESFHLTLSSQPAEAQVEWDGKVVGQTPLMIDLLPGPQTFVLRRDGLYNATVMVNVTPSMAGRTESRTVVMVPRAVGVDAAIALAAAATPVAAHAAQGKGRAAPSDAPDTAGPERATLIDPTELPLASATTDTELDSVRAPKAALALALATPAAPAAPVPATPAPTPPAPRAPTVLPFGPDMTRPVLLSSADLVVPREARVAHVSGTMIARCTITADGSLRDCRIIKGLPFLNQPMLDSLATRRYRPVQSEGKPVSVQYVFNLKVESLS